MNTLVRALRRFPALVDRVMDGTDGERIGIWDLREALDAKREGRGLLPDPSLLERAQDDPLGQPLLESYVAQVDADRWRALVRGATPLGREWHVGRLKHEWRGDRLAFVRGTDRSSGVALPDEGFDSPSASLFADIGGQRRRISVRASREGTLEVAISIGKHCSLPDWDDGCDPGECHGCELKELDNGDVVCRCTCPR